MLRDFSLPVENVEPPHSERVARSATWRTAHWTPEALSDLGSYLARQPNIFTSGLTRDDLSMAWAKTVATFRDPGSLQRGLLSEPLVELCRLSPAGLAAGLDAVLGGVSIDSAAAVFEEAVDWAPGSGLVVVILASNLPALAVQALLPALVLGRPVLIKSARAEPIFTPAFIETLCHFEPRLRPGVAAVTWPGGEDSLEEALFPWASKVVAYGGAEAMSDLRARVGPRLVPRGPKLSLALLGAAVEVGATARGLASDIALFDQRGCLSVQAIYCEGDPEALADAVAEALVERWYVWPQGTCDPDTVGQVQVLRTEATMRGLYQPRLPLEAGTVVVDPRLDLRPTPGLRTVRIHPVRVLGEALKFLEEWRGQLQGAALAGASAWEQESLLKALGLTRLAAPGALQSPDASWHNGGLSPLEAIAS